MGIVYDLAKKLADVDGIKCKELPHNPNAALLWKLHGEEVLSVPIVCSGLEVIQNKVSQEAMEMMIASRYKAAKETLAKAV
jgi:hypothetical protein